MKKDKEYTEGISVKSNKFLAWLDNFWYHYKWHTIVTAFIVAVLGICLVQCAFTDSGDVIFTYAGPKEFVTAPQEKQAINSTISDVTKKTYGDKSSAVLNSFLIFSKNQIEEIESELDENGKQKYVVDTAFNTSQMNSFDEFSRSGASHILLLDPSIYQRLINQSGEAERLVELSAIYGETPEGARDKYSVRLGDTELYKNIAELRALPADTVVCLHGRLILSTNQADYDKQMAVFKDFALLAQVNNNEEEAS